jgi:uncharacterized protein (DUF362 family)
MKMHQPGGWTRREFLWGCLAGALLVGSGLAAWRYLARPRWREATFIARAKDYSVDLGRIILAGLKELGVSEEKIRGKRVLLKPNLVETVPGAIHINTHPLVVRGAAEAFLNLGASRVLVAEGPGHRRDTLLVLEESGLSNVLYEDRIPFVDLNDDVGYTVLNAGKSSRLEKLILPVTLKQVDYIVSLAKMKTHHWTGITLSMKNLFGVMPGSFYGWPKNLLHWAGINEAIFDITATLKPDFAIVDGVVGMEGDGPIMGTPKYAGVLVMGGNLPAVDATCARIMGLNPYKVEYLKAASGRLGPIAESEIRQRGERIAAVKTKFQLLQMIPAHRDLYAGGIKAPGHPLAAFPG